MNRLSNRIKKLSFSLKLFSFLAIIFSFQGFTQNDIERYNIGKIEVTGNTSFSPITIVTFSGLREGDAISIPGEKLSNAIKKLWGSNLFSSVNFLDSCSSFELEKLCLPLNIKLLVFDTSLSLKYCI